MNYPDHVYYDDLTDDDDDEVEYSRGNIRYCGFAKNFLDKGVSKQLPHYKTVKGITHEEAAKNAKELIAEEEKLKKKAEKKKQKKTRQRERRRLEKLEKESGNKADSKKLDMSSCFVTNAAAIAKRKLEQQPKTDRKDKKVENNIKHGTAHKNTSKSQIKNVSENVSEASDEPIKDNVTKSMELAVIGNKYAQTGNLDMAVKCFTDAIKHNPQEFKLFGNRSFCYEKMQQYEKALIDADIALSLNTTWIKGLYRKGKALVGLKRYYDACLTYKEVLVLDSSCTDAAQELMRVQIMQLMDMGYTREQSSNALIIYGTVEKALEALSGLHGNVRAAHLPFKKVGVFPERTSQPTTVPLRSHSASPTQISQDSPKVSTSTLQTPRALFPVWVGDLVPVISEVKLRELFSRFGPVYSVRLLSIKRCAFINYINKEDCEKAIKEMHGFHIAGTCLTVRYPERIHTHLGVSKAAETDAGKLNKFPDECSFWRTTGCIKSNRCPYRHVPEHKGIDRPQHKC
ncbi:Tetratricopeptide repeat protein 31 [Bagarius yarrelli]|uniref:Tetratricopeptide repeat protein 31 n=1 Tax=Bagarius yarrelli TaxID=175774 RepID=A0A556V6A5_BAGYA|nr:Tetratricopeptide repeat protein 31 [Bagarius yarrelli]